MSKKVITSEFVSWGHPDKIADQISDAILEELLYEDSKTRAGIEVLVKDNIVVLGGEINSKGKVDYDIVVRSVFEKLPFPENHNLQPENIKIINLIGKQSFEIHQGVDKSNDIIGAGDQGFMVGFASDETEEYLPLGVYLAKHICQYISKQTHLGFGPDTKTQVIVDYFNNEMLLFNDIRPHIIVESILVSTMQQGDLTYDRELIKNIILNNDMKIDSEIYKKYIKNNETLVITVNPCGEWRIGGPISDCGVTGRKIVVDQFGGYSNVGGGGLSGKDLSKVDRSAAYMARYLAKNIVASGIANTCKVELSYMIGIPNPSSINIELNKNQHLVPEIKAFIEENVNLTPKAIIDKFSDCFEPYRMAVEGHYGNMMDCWEEIDFAKDLKEYLY